LIRNDKLRPLTAQRIEIGLDADNNIVGWRHRIVNESYFARILPPDLFAKIKQDIVSGGGGEMSYAVANHRVEWVRAPRGVDVGAWRGIAAGYTKFAIETLMDEIAALKKMDPLDYRLAMLKSDPRAANVLQRVADMSSYKTKRDGGRAVGIAYSDALHSHTAVAAEVSVDTATGQIKVHHLWAAVDPGTVVQPKNVVAQNELRHLSGPAHVRHPADGRASDLDQRPADGHRRSGRSRGRAGDCQRGRPVDRQAPAPPADDAGPGEAVARLKASTPKLPPQTAKSAAAFLSIPGRLPHEFSGRRDQATPARSCRLSGDRRIMAVGETYSVRLRWHCTPGGRYVGQDL